jgi:hypothetical protein
LVQSFAVFEPVKTGLGLGPSLSRPKDQTRPDLQTLDAMEMVVDLMICPLSRYISM